VALTEKKKKNTRESTNQPEAKKVPVGKEKPGTRNQILGKGKALSGDPLLSEE